MNNKKPKITDKTLEVDAEGIAQATAVHRAQRRYYSSLVAALTGLSVRTLNDWATTIISAGPVPETDNVRQTRHWRYRHVVVLRIGKLLRDNGLPLSYIEHVMNFLLENAQSDDARLEQKILLTNGSQSWIVYSEEELGQTLKELPQWQQEPQVFLTLHMGRIVADLDQAWRQWYAANQARKGKAIAGSDATAMGQQNQEPELPPPQTVS